MNSYAAAAGAGEAVRFPGRSAEPERYYQGADIFVCRSSYEGSSLAFLEARATGLPLVSTRVGLASAWIEREGDPAGILVGRQAEVGAAFAALAADAERRTRCEKVARQSTDQFGWDPLADKVDEMYRGLFVGTTLKLRAASDERAPAEARPMGRLSPQRAIPKHSRVGGVDKVVVARNESV